MFLDFLILIYESINVRNRLKHQGYDPINFKTLNEHSNWVLEESLPFLTVEEVEALYKTLQICPSNLFQVI